MYYSIKHSTCSPGEKQVSACWGCSASGSNTELVHHPSNYTVVKVDGATPKRWISKGP